MVSPPCSTFYRVRTANPDGPAPLCSHKFVRGYPWLSKTAKAQVKNSNWAVDFAAKILREQVGNGTGHHILLEHPEDLGCRTNYERPASIWQWPQIRRLAKLPGVQSGALYQADFGAEFRKPTRLVANMPFADTLVTIGPPSSDNQGQHLGPLEKRKWLGPVLVGENAARSKRKGPDQFQETCVKPSLNEPAVGSDVILGPRVLKRGEVSLAGSTQVSRLQVATPVTSRTATSSRASARLRACGRKVTKDELVTVRKEIPLVKDLIYVGRVPGCKGYRSAWENPTKMETHGLREGVIALYRQHVQDSEIKKEIRGSDGARRLKLATVTCPWTCWRKNLAGKLKKPRAFDLNPDNFKGNCPDDEVLLEFIADGLISRVSGLVNNDELKKDMLGGGWRGRGQMVARPTDPSSWTEQRDTGPRSRPPREVSAANIGGQGRAFDLDVEVGHGQDHQLAFRPRCGGRNDRCNRTASWEWRRQENVG